MQPHLGEHVESVGVGQLHVERHQVGQGRLAQRADDVVALLGGAHREAFHLDVGAQQLEHVRIVVHHQDRELLALLHLARGGRTARDAHVVALLLQRGDALVDLGIRMRCAAAEKTGRHRDAEETRFQAVGGRFGGAGDQGAAEQLARDFVHRARREAARIPGDLRQRRAAVDQHQDLEFGRGQRGSRRLQLGVALVGKGVHILVLERHSTPARVSRILCLFGARRPCNVRLRTDHRRIRAHASTMLANHLARGNRETHRIPQPEIT